MKMIIEDRFIVPGRFEASFGSPTERLLKSTLNPENKNQIHDENIESGNFITEDASLSDFMEKLLQIINLKDN